jgi:hypothetical protein
MEPDPLAAEQLTLGPEGVGQHPAQERPGPRRLVGKLIEQPEPEDELARRLERHEHLGQRLKDQVAGGLGIGEEVGICHRGGVARRPEAASGDHHLLHQIDHAWVAAEQPRQVRERAQRDDRHLPGVGPERLPDHLLGDMPAVERHLGQVDPTEAVGAVEEEWPRGQFSVGRCRTQPGQARRIEQVDQRLEVRGGPLVPDATGRGSYGEDFETRVEQRHRQRHGIVDARIDVDDHLAGHGTTRSWAPRLV